MELKKMKCLSCGGKLEVFEEDIKIFCKFCGPQVVIDGKAAEVSRIAKK